MAVKPVATTETLISWSTGLLSTKSTSSEPSLSVICIVESDPPLNLNETIATVIKQADALPSKNQVVHI